jgi:acyl-CoA dehydrogenase
MRMVAQLRKAFDMMCERALSRETQGERLAEKQMVQERIADSWIEIEQFRLLVLRTAWLIDKYKDYKRTRKDIAAIKVAMPKVLHDVAQRAMHLHGALGVSDEMPFMGLLLAAEVMGIADGPTEVHKVTVARQVLRDYKPADGLWPSEHLPSKRAAARERLAHLLEGEVGNL